MVVAIVVVVLVLVVVVVYELLAVSSSSYYCGPIDSKSEHSCTFLGILCEFCRVKRLNTSLNFKLFYSLHKVFWDHSEHRFIFNKTNFRVAEQSLEQISLLNNR